MYESFAEVYDRLMDDVDYADRTRYLLGLFERFDRRPALLLDLACGTGGFSLAFAGSGIQVIGVDFSEEMLSVAGEKAASAGLEILYLCQDAAALDLYGTVDGAVCCMDSLNHILDFRDFCRVFERVSLFLEPGRLFLFDLNTPFKHTDILGDNTFILEREGVYCVWQNSLFEKEHITDIRLELFMERGGLYERKTEDFSERYYEEREVLDALKAAGLRLEAVYADLTENAPDGQTDRVIYVTRKV